MANEHFDEWLRINPFVQKLSPHKQQLLYKELKSHGEVENCIRQLKSGSFQS